MTLESNKNLGGIGAILMFIGVLPFPYSGIISIVGLILVIVAMYGLANYYKESGIFNNALYGIITAIVGVVIVAIVAFTVLFGFLADLGLEIGNVAEWSTALSQIDWQTVGLDLIGTYPMYLLLDIVILYVVVIVTALFIRKSLGLLSAKTGVGMFGTTGLLILIGAIIPLIGLLLIWIALLLLAVAFFSIRPQPAQLATPAETPTPV